MRDVISAISTAHGAGGVAIIRLSGQNALEIAEKMFSPAGKTGVKDFIDRKSTRLNSSHP